jgi:hypothetical protein
MAARRTWTHDTFCILARKRSNGGGREAACVPANPGIKTRHESVVVAMVTFVIFCRRRQGPERIKEVPILRSFWTWRLCGLAGSGTVHRPIIDTYYVPFSSLLEPISMRSYGTVQQFASIAWSDMPPRKKRKARHPTPANSLTVLRYIFVVPYTAHRARGSFVQSHHPRV